MIRTADINAALRLRFTSPEWALMFEVGQGTGAHGGRYADAIAMNLYPSRGLEIHGFEVKVSRSDWQRELKNPEKAEKIFQYCDRWWIVAPDGIVSQVELPPTWGLMEYKDDKLKIVHQAPKLEARPLSRPFFASLMRRSSQLDESTVTKLVETRLRAAREEDAKRLERTIETRLSVMKSKLDKVEEIEKAAGISFTDWGAGPEMGLAIKAIKASGLFST